MKYFIVIIIMIVCLIINIIVDHNINIVPNVNAYIEEINYYDETPYHGVKNFEEWMMMWRKDVNEMLRKQKIEWERKFRNE